jgi:glycosyltransferase involved in cell wall biosynthesis
MGPKVSIIIPNYNHAVFLEQRLQTVLQQTFQAFEVILLDDASTDRSQEFLKSYENHPKVSCLLINEKNSGSPFRQWQKGIAQAKGEYIWIAESDDYSELHFLETLLSKINNITGICYAQTVDVDENGNTLSNRVVYTEDFVPNIWRADFDMQGNKFIEKYLSVKNVVPNASAVLFKRELVDQTIFSEKLLNMKMCGDWFFWARIMGKTQVSFVSEPLNYFRNHVAISRMHTNKEQKKQRLLEEASIRHMLYETKQVYNNHADKRLLKKWFQLHKLKALFSSSFYSLTPTCKHKFFLLLKFISFKLKK